MTDKSENILKELKRVRLTKAERATGRDHLMQFMAVNPVAAAPTPIPNYFWPILGIVSGGLTMVIILLAIGTLEIPEFPQNAVKSATELEDQLIETKTGEDIEDEVFTITPNPDSTSQTTDTTKPVEESTSTTLSCTTSAGTGFIMADGNCYLPGQTIPDTDCTVSKDGTCQALDTYPEPEIITDELLDSTNATINLDPLITTVKDPELALANLVKETQSLIDQSELISIKDKERAKAHLETLTYDELIKIKELLETEKSYAIDDIIKQ